MLNHIPWTFSGESAPLAEMAINFDKGMRFSVVFFHHLFNFFDKLLAKGNLSESAYQSRKFMRKEDARKHVN